MVAESGIPHGRARLNQATEILTLILANSRAPADHLIDQYFRAHRNMGSKDRAFAADSVYGCLRHKAELEALATPVLPTSSTDERRVLWLVGTYLLKHSGWSARALADAGFPGDVDALVRRVRSARAEDLPFTARINMPEWLAEKLKTQFGETDTIALSDALNRAAPVGIRANTLRITRDELRAKLEAEAYPCEPMRYSPFGLQRGRRGPMFNTEAFRQGLFEVQDEGSQLLGLMTEAKPKDKAVDFCAGAGGKTLELAAMMQNAGVVYACDVSIGRLDRLKPRLARAAAYNTQIMHIRDEHDPSLKKLESAIDVVLVDAPCSGTGTVRRNPDIKWRTINLDALTRAQASILDAAAKLTKNGGRLVYATCSLLDEENGAVTRTFLKEHPEFEVVPAQEIMERQGVPLTDGYGDDGSLKLLTHKHDTDGFYALAMRRKISA